VTVFVPTNILIPIRQPFFPEAFPFAFFFRAFALARPALRAIASRSLASAGGNKIYAGEGLVGLLQALSFGRFATIWWCLAVPSVSSVTNSQPSSPSLFSSVNSSLGVWNCCTIYSHFCMTNHPFRGFFFPHRAAAAFLAISVRRSGDTFLSRARTIASACSFFFFAILMLTLAHRRVLTQRVGRFQMLQILLRTQALGGSHAGQPCRHKPANTDPVE